MTKRELKAAELSKHEVIGLLYTILRDETIKVVSNNSTTNVDEITNWVIGRIGIIDKDASK